MSSIYANSLKIRIRKSSKLADPEEEYFFYRSKDPYERKNKKYERKTYNFRTHIKQKTIFSEEKQLKLSNEKISDAAFGLLELVSDLNSIQKNKVLIPEEKIPQNHSNFSWVSLLNSFQQPKKNSDKNLKRICSNKQSKAEPMKKKKPIILRKKESCFIENKEFVKECISIQNEEESNTQPSSNDTNSFTKSPIQSNFQCQTQLQTNISDPSSFFLQNIPIITPISIVPNTFPMPIDIRFVPQIQHFPINLMSFNQNVLNFQPTPNFKVIYAGTPNNCLDYLGREVNTYPNINNFNGMSNNFGINSSFTSPFFF